MRKNLLGIAAAFMPAIGSPISVFDVRTTVADVDLNTGIPWYAVQPEDTSFLGNTSHCVGYPFALTRSQLCDLWFSAKEYTLTGPDAGTSVLDIRRIFTSTPPHFGPNNFAVDGQSFYYPLEYDVAIGLPYEFELDFSGSIDSSIFTDGTNYFPRMGITASDTNPVSTNGDSSSGVAGSALLKNFNGDVFATAPLFNLSFGGPPYGDIICQVTDEW